MMAITRALEPLDEITKRRVLSWAVARFGAGSITRERTAPAEALPECGLARPAPKRLRHVGAAGAFHARTRRLLMLRPALGLSIRV
jgi:hypothetical protein